MGYKPYTLHIAAMVDKLSDESIRAIYMVVKKLYEMERSTIKE